MGWQAEMDRKLAAIRADPLGFFALHHAYEMSRWSGRRMFNRQCRKRLGISRREFLMRLDRGDYNGTDCGTRTGDAIMHLAILAPFGR